MLSHRIALALVGGACVVAAGTGAYVASRHNATPPAAVESRTSTADESGTPAPVQETEAALDPQGIDSPPAAPPTDTPAPPKAATPAPRPVPPARTPQPTSRPPHRQIESPAPAARTEESRPGRSAASEPPTRDRVATMPPARTEPVEPLALPPLANDRGGERVDSRSTVAAFDELVVPADSVVGLQLDSTLSSETAQVEDRVSARVTRDVRVGGRVAIPSGSRVLGAVTVADRGGKMRERSRLGVRFHTLVLADGTNVPIQTDTIYREGDSPSSASSAKIGGGAIGGAIIGGILGGAKGAIIGGSTGAAGGTAAVLAGGRKPVTMTAGSTMTVRVLSPVSVTVDRQQN
jgi:type IV secretory pathway VirB10-like protein